MQRIAMASCVFSGEQVKQAAADEDEKQKLKKAKAKAKNAKDNEAGSDSDGVPSKAIDGRTRFLVDRLDALISRSIIIVDGVWDDHQRQPTSIVRLSQIRFFLGSTVTQPHEPPTAIAPATAPLEPVASSASDDAATHAAEKAAKKARKAEKRERKAAKAAKKARKAAKVAAKAAAASETSSDSSDG